MKFKYFVHSFTTQDGIEKLCDEIQNDGCEIVQFLTGQVPLPPSVIVPPGAPRAVAGVYVFVRCLADKHAEIMENLKKKNQVDFKANTKLSIQ